MIFFHFMAGGKWSAHAICNDDLQVNAGTKAALWHMHANMSRDHNNQPTDTKKYIYQYV